MPHFENSIEGKKVKKIQKRQNVSGISDVIVQYAAIRVWEKLPVPGQDRGCLAFGVCQAPVKPCAPRTHVAACALTRASKSVTVISVIMAWPNHSRAAVRGAPSWGAGPCISCYDANTVNQCRRRGGAKKCKWGPQKREHSTKKEK